MTMIGHVTRSWAREVVEYWPLFPHILLAMLAIWVSCHLPSYLKLVSTPFVVLCVILYLYLVDSEQHRFQNARLERTWTEQCQRQQQAHQTTSPTHTSAASSSVETWVNGLVSACWPAWETGLISNILEVKIREILAPICGNKILLERLRLGSSPPLMHSCKLRYPSMVVAPATATTSSSPSSSSGPTTTDRDAIQLDMDLSFVAGDNMGVVFTVPMGYFATKLFCDHLTIKCKLRIGLKFVAYSPYVSSLSVCFLSMPNLNFSIRPMSSNGLALTDLPVVANWVSNSIHLAIQHCGLVYPDKMDIDFIQLWGTDYGLNMDSVKQESKGCYAILEIIEGRHLMGKDMSGFSDPYVTITRVGDNEKQPQFKFKTKVRKQTLNPSWRESFTIPITTSLDSSYKLLLRCRDRDVFVDDELGFAELDLNLYKDGKRHEIAFKLRNADHGELLVATTVVGASSGNKPNPISHTNDEVLLHQLQDMISKTMSKTSSNPNSNPNDQALLKQLQDMISQTNTNPSYDQARSSPLPRRSITNSSPEPRSTIARRRSTIRANTLPGGLTEHGLGANVATASTITTSNSYGTTRRASTTYARRQSAASVAPINHARRRSSINSSSTMASATSSFVPRTTSPPFVLDAGTSSTTTGEEQHNKLKHKHHLFPFGSYFKHKSKTKEAIPKPT